MEVACDSGAIGDIICLARAAMCAWQPEGCLQGREIPGHVLSCLDSCLTYTGRSQNTVAAVAEFIKDCTLGMLEGIRHCRVHVPAVMACFRKIFRADKYFSVFYAAGQSPTCTTVHYSCLLLAFRQAGGWDTLLTCLQEHAANETVEPLDAYHVAVPLAEILKANVERCGFVKACFASTGTFAVLKTYRNFFDPRRIHVPSLSFEKAAAFQQAAAAASACLNAFFAVHTECPASCKLAFTKFTRPWQCRLVNFTTEVLNAGGTDVPAWSLKQENALERFVAGLFSIGVDDPKRKLSKNEVSGVNGCIQATQQLIIRSLKAPGPLSRAMKRLLGSLFLREAHPCSFFMINGACSHTSKLAKEVKGRGFEVPLSGASFLFIENANIFYAAGGFDAILRRLQEPTDALTMKDILLYVDVFEVVRYCCTREWMQKYVMSTFLAVEKHLHRPCFASIDSKLNNAAAFKLVIRKTNNFLLKCLETYMFASVWTTEQESIGFQVMRCLQLLQEDAILKKLEGLEKKHAIWISKAAFIRRLVYARNTTE